MLFFLSEISDGCCCDVNSTHKHTPTFPVVFFRLCFIHAHLCLVHAVCVPFNTCSCSSSVILMLAGATR